MDTRITRRATGIGLGLLLAIGAGAAAQEPVPGYTWEPFAPSDGEGYFVSDFITGPQGQLAVFGEKFGTDEGDEEGRAIWTSDDDGETWTEAVLAEQEWAPLYAYHDRYADEGRATAAATDEQYVLAVTVPGKTKRTYILTSPDGVEWNEAAKLNNVHVEDILSTPDGLAMLGLEYRKAKGFGKRLAGYPTLWLSSDGLDWEAHEISPPLYKPKDPDEIQGLNRIARSDDGTWIAQGVLQRDGKDGRVFRSTVWTANGDLEWSEATPPVIHKRSGDRWRLFGSTREGFLLMGTHLDAENGVAEGGLWLTSGLGEWEQVADTPMPPPEVAVTTPDGVVAWAAPFIWTNIKKDKTEIVAGAPRYESPDGRTWTHDPETDVTEGIWVGLAQATPSGHMIVQGTDISDCVGQYLWCPMETDAPLVTLFGTPT